jgi:cell division protein FtsA
MQHSRIYTSIDIGTFKITTLIGQYFESDQKLNIIGSASVPASGFKKGQIINLEQASHTITESIESAERMAGVEINSAFVSLTAPHFESLNSHGVTAVGNQNGEISTEDISRAVEAAKAITLPANKEIVHVIPRVFTVDGQEGVIDPIGMNGIRLEVEAHLILASTPALKNLNKCLEDIGIKTLSLAFSGLTAAKACLSDTETELGVALVDIGGSNTTITLFSENSPLFSSCLPIGANNITADLAIGLRLPLVDSEKIKVRLNHFSEKKGFEDEIDLQQFGVIGENNKISFSTTLNGIIKPRLNEIINLIWNEICSHGFQSSIPAGLVLTGGGAETLEIKNIASQIIPLPIRIGEPPKLGGIVDDITNPAYSSAIGTLLFFANSKLTPKNSSHKINLPFRGFMEKIKSFLEPLLP